MQKFVKLGAALATLSATLLSGAAQAAPWTFTTTGIIQSGYDSSGIFGVVGGNLFGKAYSMSIVVDHDLYQYQSNTNAQINDYGRLTGFAQEMVTVNGVTKSYTFDLNKNNSGQSYLYATPSFTQAYQYQSGTTTDGYILSGQHSVYAWNNAAYANLASNPTFSYSAKAGDSGYAYFNLNGNGANTYFNAGTPATISITTGEVPEPAPLALFGLGLVAFGVVRRKARA